MSLVKRLFRVETNLQGRRISSQLAWLITAASILIVFTAFGLSILESVSSGDYRTLLSHQALIPFTTTVYAVIGALVASRHPRNPIGWIFVAVGCLYALSSLTTVFVDGLSTAPLSGWAAWLSNWLWIPAAVMPVTFVLMLFPDGHLPSPRWILIAWSAALGLVVIVLVVMAHPSPLASWGLSSNPFGIPEAVPVLDQLNDVGFVLLLTGVLGSLAGFSSRFRRSQGIEREQMKWLAYAVGPLVLGTLFGMVAGYLWPETEWANEISIAVNNLTILGLAVAAAAAILRHRLYDINLIINRTLVYGTLTVGVAVLYGLVVGALGALFQARSNFVVSLLATGFVAVVFQPLRERLQRAVNRLMYGDRDDPYIILSRLGQRLQDTLAPEAVLAAVVETIAQALKLPYAAVKLRHGDELRLAAEYGVQSSAMTKRLSGAEELVIPLIHQSETLGELILCSPASRPSFTLKDQHLLEDIARQAGVAVHAVRLTLDLQHSRELLVKSREEERRRLRRDLHDDLGPQLASLKLNLDVARNLVSRDPQAAEALLVDLRTQTQAAIADIRRLVNDLRPPALDEYGLKGAIQEYARRIERQDRLRVQVEAPAVFPPLPAAVEVAAYRITLEALANVVRHSQGRNCRVTISLTEKDLYIDICDDGLGLPGEIEPGVGLSSMLERALELGGTCRFEPLPSGGTRVSAQLPLL